MSRPEARKRAAEQRRTRIKASGGRILQIALRAESAKALAMLEARDGEKPSKIIERLLVQEAQN